MTGSQEALDRFERQTAWPIFVLATLIIPSLLLPLDQRAWSLQRTVREVLDLIVGRSGDLYLCVAPVGENPSNVTNRRIVEPRDRLGDDKLGANKTTHVIEPIRHFIPLDPRRR